MNKEYKAQPSRSQQVLQEYLGTPDKLKQFTDEKEGPYIQNFARKRLEKLPQDVIKELTETLLRQMTRTDDAWTIKKQQATLKMINVLPFYKLGDTLAIAYTQAIETINSKDKMARDSAEGLLQAGKIITGQLRLGEKRNISKAWEEKEKTFTDKHLREEIHERVTEIFTRENTSLLPPEDNSKISTIEKVSELTENGKNYMQIATELGISEETVKKYQGAIWGNGKLAPENIKKRIERTRELVEQGLTPKEIAEELNVTKNTVLNYIKRIKKLSQESKQDEKVPQSEPIVLFTTTVKKPDRERETTQKVASSPQKRNSFEKVLQRILDDKNNGMSPAQIAKRRHLSVKDVTKYIALLTETA